MGMGQVRPVLLERPLRIVGWSWGRLRFELVQRAVVPRTGFGFGGKGEGVRARREGRQPHGASPGWFVRVSTLQMGVMLQVFGGGGWLRRVGDLRVVTGASEGEPVEAGL